MTDAIEPYEFIIAGIDTRGNRKIPSEQITDLLGVSEGTRFDRHLPNIRKMRENVEAFGYFSHVDVALVLYPDGKAYITVDVIEKGSGRQFIFRSPASGSVHLPDNLLEQYAKYLAQWGQSIRRHLIVSIPNGEGSPSRHRFSADMRLRTYEETFIDLAQRHLQSLIDALESDRHARKRAVAAFMLGWTPDPAPTVLPLSNALGDSQPVVRNNAALSLASASRIAIETGAFEVPLSPILEMLHLPFTTDRQKAALVLTELAKSEKSRPTILKEAGNQLMQMLALKQPSNREAARAVLHQMSGLEYTADQYERWNQWYQQAIRGTVTPLLEASG